MTEVWVLMRSFAGRTLVLGVFTEWSLLGSYLTEHCLPIGTLVEPGQEPSQAYWSIEHADFTYTIERVTLRGAVE
jgi:hypothetical protein